MKWYVLPSLLVCGLNCVLAAVILALAAFHVNIDARISAPVALHDEWIRVVRNLIPFCAVWSIISLVGIFASVTKRQIYLASMVLALFGALFGVSIYFMVAFVSQLEMEDVQTEVLYNLTVTEIRSQNAEAWIPVWLENIQKQSKECCGIVTYRDYADFWPNTSTKIPLSCCRDSTKLSEPCPADLTRIPFPQTSDNFIKVEMGCMEEINTAMRRHIRETFYLSSLAVAFLGLALLTFLAFYIPQYLMGASWLKMQKQRTGSDSVASDNNMNSLTGSGPVLVASDGQVVGPIGSTKGIQAFVSVQSLPAQDNVLSVAPERPKPFLIGNNKETGQTQQGVNLQLLSQASLGKLNKANAVFAGLQQQQKQQQFPDASTGEDMTVGGGNIGRREVFVVQDATAQTMLPATNSILRNSRANKVGGSTSMSDFAGDVIHVEQAVTVVPGQTYNQPQQVGKSGSPERSKIYKLKKFAATFGHHHNHDAGNQ